MRKTVFTGLRLCILPLAACLAGCLGDCAPEPRRWTFETVEVAAIPGQKEPVWGVLRVSRLVVAAPYDGLRLAVRRKDGTLAFDSRNVFAASPAALLRVPTREVLAASGLAKAVVTDNSGARADQSLEIEVDTLALECVQEVRTVKIALVATCVDNHRFMKTARGEASVAVEKDLTAALSRAYIQALTKALAELAQ